MTAPSPFPFFSSSESGVPVKRALLILPVAAIALAACSPADVEVDGTAVPASRRIESSTPPPVEPARVDPYVTPVDVVDEVVRSVAADEGITVPAGTGSEYADIVCTAFEDGVPFLLIVSIAASELPEWTPEQHAYLVGASVGAACPQWADEVGGAA